MYRRTNYTLFPAFVAAAVAATEQSFLPEKNAQIREHGIRHFCFNPEQPSAPAWSKGGKGWVRGIKLIIKKWGSKADHAFFPAISLSFFYESQGKDFSSTSLQGAEGGVISN
jgi:hypothetical protein